MDNNQVITMFVLVVLSLAAVIGGFVSGTRKRKADEAAKTAQTDAGNGE